MWMLLLKKKMMMMMLLLFLLLTVSVVSDDDAANCAMDIWIFSSFEGCQASDAPVANGIIYADGQCHTIETDLDPTHVSYSSFPGNYRVQCVDTNKIRFSDSACLDNTCSSTSSVNGTAVCDRDNSSPASLFSRLSPPEFAVQDPSNANIGAFYTCLKLNGGSDVTVTFVVFGDCTQSGCVMAPPTTPVPVTPAPIVVAAPTPSPIIPTTSVPVTTTIAPVSLAPTFNDTTTITNAPTPSPSSNNTTTTPPVPVPAAVVTLAPTTIIPSTTVPLSPPTVSSSRSPTNNNSGGGGLVHDVISVAIRLSPMNQTIDTSSNSISQWEDVTMEQIRTVAQTDAVYNAMIYAMDISNITQSVIDLTAKATNSDDSDRRFRRLQDDNNNLTTTISTGTTTAMALQIEFDVTASLTPSTGTTSLADLFTASFDSEQDRSNYLIKLVTNDDLFKSVRLVKVLYVNGTNGGNKAPPPPTAPATPVTAPTIEQTSNSDEKSGSMGLLIALAGGGSALIVFAVLGIVMYQRKHSRNGDRSGGSKEIITREGETPSDDNDEYYGGDDPVGPLNFANNHRHNKNNLHSPMSKSQQRWTNEIVVDPSADDVSTLGGSVLASYLDPTTNDPNNDTNNNNNTSVEDEPTASVNLDFDYNKNQYRSDVEDRSRTVNTETTGPSTFTNFTTKLGMNGEAIFSDDASFDELYAEIDDETDTNEKTNHPPRTMLHHSSHLNKIASMVKPFEVRAPPGKLGMVVDTPNGGVPVVRAIRPDSVLHGNVLVGDRLISVDNKDVTNMTALDVSSLISLKQHQHRLLVFCRLQQQSPKQASVPMITTTAATTPQNSMFAQPSPAATAMATTSY